MPQMKPCRRKEGHLQLEGKTASGQVPVNVVDAATHANMLNRQSSAVAKDAEEQAVMDKLIT